MQSTTTLQETQEGGFSATANTNAAAFNNHLISTSASAATAAPTIQPCSTRRGSMKRSSPSSATPSPDLHEPRHKKATIDGFTKLALPIPFPSPSPSTTALRRTISEPINVLGFNNTPNAPFAPFSHSSAASASGHCLNPRIQEMSKNNLQGSSPSPPNASHGLLRSISDPTSLAFGVSTRKSPSSQRLEKMKGIFGEISQLFNQAIHEDEDEESSDDNNIENKIDSDCDLDGDQEAVSVEKKGDCLVVHFNCPCGKAYQILLSGNNCYYKLT